MNLIDLILLIVFALIFYLKAHIVLMLTSQGQAVPKNVAPAKPADPPAGPQPDAAQLAAGEILPHFLVQKTGQGTLWRDMIAK